MDREAKLLVWTAIIVAVVAMLIVQMWPRRRFREVVVTRRIAAPAERIWDAYVNEPDNPVSVAFHKAVSSVRTIGTDPRVLEIVGDASGGQGGSQTVVHAEILAEQRPCLSAVRFISVDGRPYPFGREQCEELRLTQEPDAVVATVTWRGELATLGQRWALGKRLTQYMDSLKEFSETGQSTAIPQARRSPWRSLALTVLAFGSFAFLFGWLVALILSIAIVIHEFGHWLAMRMTGQPKPRIMLVPFFGGAAVPNHPYKTQFDRAFVALAGAGFSLLPCLAFLLGAIALGLPDVAKLGIGLKTAQFSTGRGLLGLALIFAFLNALQLLPVLPLDGGHVLRSLIESTGARRARPVLLTLAIGGMAGFVVMGDYILAAILALGAMQAWHVGEVRQVARPMTGPGLAAVGVGYLVILGLHAGTAVYAMRVLGVGWG